MTAQPTLWEAQTVNLQRVRGRIGPTVLQFCTGYLNGIEDKLFYMRELEEYVSKRVPGAPDSPSRILRILRQDGFIDYEVVNRRQSLYRLTNISRATTAGAEINDAPSPPLSQR